MNSCFEKFAGLKRIISEIVLFSYYIKLYRCWGNFQFYYEKKGLLWKRQWLILEELIMSDRYMSHGQMHSFLQFFLTLKKLD